MNTIYPNAVASKMREVKICHESLTVDTEDLRNPYRLVQLASAMAMRAINRIEFENRENPGYTASEFSIELSGGALEMNLELSRRPVCG